MSFKGTVKNGVVVLPPEAKLPDGTAVEVIADEWRPEDDPFVAAALKVAKPRPHWPKDYTRNLDHYLYSLCVRVGARQASEHAVANPTAVRT